MSQLYVYALPVVALGLFFQFFSGQLAAAAFALGLLSLLGLTMAGLGRVLLKAFVRSHLSESERTLIGCTIGLGALSQASFLLGIAGLYGRWTIIALLAVAWLVSFTELREMALSLRADRNLLQGRRGWAVGIGALLLLPLAFAFVPPHSYDALVYHLALPAEYLRAGRITAINHLVYTHFPQNAEMLFGLGLALGSDTVAHLMSWLATALSVWWVFEMGKREMPLNAALLAAALVASHTAVMLLSSIAYVETITMLWITASVLCLLRWLELGDEERGWLLLSGVFAGLGVGTKYFAGITPAAAALFLVATRRWRAAGLFTAMCLATGLPWLLKNAAVIGNPVFPFLYDWFALPPGSGWDAATAKGYFHALTEYAPRKETLLWDLARLPLLMATADARFGGGADVLGRLGWATLLLLSPLAAAAAARHRQLRLVLAYLGFHLAVWFATGTVLRFLVVIVPLWALLAGAGTERLWQAAAAPGRAALAAALGLLAALQLSLFLYVNTLQGGWDVPLGLASRDEYLSKRLDYHPCARWAGERLPRNVRILLVGEQRGYHLDRDHTATAVMSSNPFVRWADEANDARSLAARLRAGGYTHLLVVPREAQRLAPYGTMNFSDKGRRNWEGLEPSLAKPIYRAPACAVLELAP